MKLFSALLILIALLAAQVHAAELEPIRVGTDGRSFVRGAADASFTPWGFNYDRDADGRLLEEYWHTAWPTVEEDFAEMQQLGANVVRIHLQFDKFMKSPTEVRQSELDRLAELTRLAERTGLYLDITGLGCYHQQDVPDWYDKLSRTDRWQAQARFWEGVAATCAHSSAVFCYNLMNEPVLPGDKQPARNWLGPAFAGKHYVQFLALELDGHSRAELFEQWTTQLAAAIRKHDDRHLITVGLVPWILNRKGQGYGFIDAQTTHQLDFLAVHLYPEAGKIEAELQTLSGFADIGKPVVIEEIFPLKCGIEELEEFLDASRKEAAGWIGFYWGEVPEKPETVGDRLTLEWLTLFQRIREEMLE